MLILGLSSNINYNVFVSEYYLRDEFQMIERILEVGVRFEPNLRGGRST